MKSCRSGLILVVLVAALERSCFRPNLSGQNPGFGDRFVRGRSGRGEGDDHQYRHRNFAKLDRERNWRLQRAQSRAGPLHSDSGSSQFQAGAAYRPAARSGEGRSRRFQIGPGRDQRNRNRFRRSAGRRTRPMTFWAGLFPTRPSTSFPCWDATSRTLPISSLAFSGLPAAAFYR